MRQWLIGLIVAAFLVPVLCAGGQDPAQPKKSAAKIVSEKKETGGWLGVIISDLSEERTKEKKPGTTEGAYVDKVADESPAASAGILKGDVIIEVEGKKISDAADLRKRIGNSSPGTKVSVVVMRDGEKKTIPVVLGTPKEHPGHIAMTPPQMLKHFEFRMHGPQLGMNIETLNEQLGEYFGAPDGEGVLVREVYKNSTAEKSGFKAGDVIIRVGKKSVDEVNVIRKALRKAAPGTSLEFEVLRKGSSKIITVPIEKHDDDDTGCCQYGMPEFPCGGFTGGDFVIPDEDIDVQINKDELHNMQKELDRLRDDLGKINIDKKIRVRVSPNDI